MSPSEIHATRAPGVDPLPVPRDPSSPSAVPEPRVAPFGAWSSPIGPALAAAAAKPLSGAQLDGGRIHWLEGVFAEGGRLTIVSRAVGVAVDEAADDARTLIPAPYNVRTRVHEYGGGAWVVDAGTIWFSDFADGRVHRRDASGRIEPVTIADARRHADFAVDRTRARLVAVEEDHGDAPRAADVDNRLVALDMRGVRAPVVLAEGRDFYAYPRVSPDGRHLAWLCWDHPRMPWDGTELWLARLDDAGLPIDARRVAGGPDESLFQPTWSPDGRLFVVSDRSGWWNLYRVDLDLDAGGVVAADGTAVDAPPTLLPVHAAAAEYGEPLWTLGRRTFGFVDRRTIAAIAIDEGIASLWRLALDDDGRAVAAHRVDTGFTSLADLAVDGESAYALASSPTVPARLVRIGLASGDVAVVADSVATLPDARHRSTPRRLSFEGHAGRRIHAVFHPPHNADFAGPAGALPPLIVQGHGGPTTMTNDGLRLGNQFWTSRGFAILDIDYTGSSGYGRDYRRALNGSWGVADLDDFVAGARFAAAEGLVDGHRMAVRGGSASGYTALSAVAFRDVFQAATSYYGIGDLAALIADTHKFESRYAGTLLGDAEHDPAALAARSPLMHVERIAVPVLFFQGMDDRVVPPSQSQAMVASLKARGVPVGYVAFAGEGHGFRKLENLVRTLEAELSFYAQVFGFEPADAVEPVALDGSDGGAG